MVRLLQLLNKVNDALRDCREEDFKPTLVSMSMSIMSISLGGDGGGGDGGGVGWL